MSAGLGPAAQFFFYGTLLDPDIQRLVIGRIVALAPATLAGFRRVRAAGKWYPMLVPGLAADRVDGALAAGLLKPEIARIVAFEGSNYALKRVTVELAARARRDGGAKRALVFVPLRGLRPTAEPWDLARWQAREKPRVMRLKLWPWSTKLRP